MAKDLNSPSQVQMHAIIAVEKSVRTEYSRIKNETEKEFANGSRYAGFNKKYTPFDAEDTTFPEEYRSLDDTVENKLKHTGESFANYIDALVTKNEGNASADVCATVVINGKEFTLSAITLLDLESKLQDLLTLYNKIPTLEPGVNWIENVEDQGYKSKPIEKLKSLKKKVPITLAEATDKHPAQVKLEEDTVYIGKWTEIAYSGKVSPSTKKAWIQKISKVLQDVELARLKANSNLIEQKRIGGEILNFIHS
jgi:hypothetical protein